MSARDFIENSSQDDIAEKLLKDAEPSCAAHCRLAQVKARQGAAFIISGHAPLEVVRTRYNDATSECPGPAEIKVCGAPEGQKTYECKMLGRLMTLSFDQ